MVFDALVFKLSVWCGAEGCVSGLRAAGIYYCVGIVLLCVLEKPCSVFRLLVFRACSTEHWIVYTS